MWWGGGVDYNLSINCFIYFRGRGGVMEIQMVAVLNSRLSELIIIKGFRSYCLFGVGVSFSAFIGLLAQTNK